MKKEKLALKIGEEGARRYYPSVYRHILRFTEGRNWLTANKVEHTLIRGGLLSFDWKSHNAKRFPIEGGANYGKMERKY